MHVDVAVLGGGPGGYVAGIRAAQLGRSVAVVEAGSWGGVCLNLGCVPARALIHNAEVADLVTRRAGQFGISGDIAVDYRAAFERSRSVSEGRVKGVHFLMRKNRITELDGWGTFRDDHTLQVALTAGGSRTVTFDHAIIATGSTVRGLPGVALSANVGTYESVVLAQAVPRSVVIVGAGAIGMEFAFVLRSYGADVTLIEALDRLLPYEDVEVSREVARQYGRLGIDVLTSTEIRTVVDHGDAVTVTLSGRGQTATAGTVRAEKVLVAVGFAPRTTGYGLAGTGVALTDAGAIDVDRFMRTSVPHLFAIGDVTAKLQRAHVAEAQGMVAAETIAGAETMALDYRMLPRATFCKPQVASFGLTEQQARDEGHDVRVARFPLTASARAHSLGEPSGFAKLVADGEFGELLGAHLVGPDVSELLPELTLAQKWDLGAAELARNIHVHPTLSEALQEGFHGLLGHMVNL